MCIRDSNTTAGNEIGMLFRSMVGSTNTDFEIFGVANAANDMDLVFESDGSSERVRFTGDGKVGIGTSSPTETLTVVDSSSTNNGTIHLGGSSYYASISQDAVSDGGVIYNSVAAGGASHGHKFHVDGSARMVINGSGNVGIGTTSPTYLLDMESTTTGLTHNLKLNKSSTTGDYAEIAFQLWDGAGTGLNTFGGSGDSRPSVVLRAVNEATNSAAGAFVVGTFTGGASNSTLTEKFRIASDGKVGIGTTSPDQTLDVSGHAQIGDGGGAVLLNFNATSNAQLKLSNAELMRLDNSGQVTLLGYGGSHAYTVPQDQSLGYTNNLNAGAFGILHRAAYDSYVTGNTYYYKSLGQSGWKAKYGAYKSTVMGMVNGEFSFDCSNAAPGSNGAAVSGLANIVKINSDGISMAAGKGISFSANSNASGTTSEILDDYEEGTYNATISCASGSITLYTSYTALRYTKIGRQVHIHGKLAMSAVSSPSGATNLNLPFSSANDTNRSGVANNIMTGFFNGSAVTNGIYPIYGNIEEASSNCRLFIMLPPVTNNIGDNHVAAGSDIHVNFTYTVQ